MPTIHDLLNKLYPQVPKDATYSLRRHDMNAVNGNPIFVTYNQTQFGNLIHSTPRNTIEKLIDNINSQVSFAELTTIEATEDNLRVTIGSNTIELSFSKDEIQNEESLWRDCAEIPELGSVQSMSLKYDPAKEITRVDHIEVGCSTIEELQKLMNTVEESRKTQSKRLRISGSQDSVHKQFINNSVLCERIDPFTHTSLQNLTHTETHIQLYFVEDTDIRVSIADIYEL